MRAMIFSQKKVPLELLCMPDFDSNENNHSCEQNLAWIPNRPKGPKLSTTSFLKPIELNSKRLSVESRYGPPFYIVKPTGRQVHKFHFTPMKPSTIVHPHIFLHCPIELPTTNFHGLLIYLATTNDHPLLRDSKRIGACFIINKRREGSIAVSYVCSLKFYLCWESHPEPEDSNPAVSASLLGISDKVHIELGKDPL